MKGIMKDDSAQWLLLSAITIVIGLSVLMVLLNSAMLSGHSSTKSIMSFPKNDIRDFKNEATLEAVELAKDSNKYHNVNFDDEYKQFVLQIKAAYMAKGAVVDIVCTPTVENSLIKTVDLKISYTNGDTSYTDHFTVVVPEVS